MLPLLMGKVAWTRKEHELLAGAYLKKKATTDKKAVAEVTSNVKDGTSTQEKKPVEKEKINQNVTKPPLPILSEEVKDRLEQMGVDENSLKQAVKPFLSEEFKDRLKQEVVVENSLKQAFKPLPPPPLDEKEKKVEPPKAEASRANKANPAENVLPSKKETEENSPERLPTIPEVAYALPVVDKSPSLKETEKEESPPQEALYIMLPKIIDLRKTSKGAFPVELKLHQQNDSMLKPQISYWVGTTDASEYVDMQHKEDDTWYYEIPDSEWAKHRSQFLFYKIRIVNKEGNVLLEGQAERELIDSFDT